MATLGAIPVIGGLGRASKVAKGVDKASDVAKAIDKTSDAAKLVSEAAGTVRRTAAAANDFEDLNAFEKIIKDTYKASQNTTAISANLKEKSYKLIDNLCERLDVNDPDLIKLENLKLIIQEADEVPTDFVKIINSCFTKPVLKTHKNKAGEIDILHDITFNTITPKSKTELDSAQNTLTKLYDVVGSSPTTINGEDWLSKDLYELLLHRSQGQVQQWKWADMLMTYFRRNFNGPEYERALNEMVSSNHIQNLLDKDGNLSSDIFNAIEKGEITRRTGRRKFEKSGYSFYTNINPELAKYYEISS